MNVLSCLEYSKITISPVSFVDIILSLEKSGANIMSNCFFTSVTVGYKDEQEFSGFNGFVLFHGNKRDTLE